MMVDLPVCVHCVTQISADPSNLFPFLGELKFLFEFLKFDEQASKRNGISDFKC
jgi:hypothetical protein